MITRALLVITAFLLKKKIKKVVDKQAESEYNNIRWLSQPPNSPIVQSVEHLTVNQGVVGSSPTRGAKKVMS